MTDIEVEFQIKENQFFLFTYSLHLLPNYPFHVTLFVLFLSLTGQVITKIGEHSRELSTPTKQPVTTIQNFQ